MFLPADEKLVFLHVTGPLKIAVFVYIIFMATGKLGNIILYGTDSETV